MPELPVIPLKVLIVDDHFLHRQIVTNVMNSFHIGHVEAVAEALAGRDQLARAQAYNAPFDIVFLDWNMPHLLGIDMLKHFRAQPAFDSTAFIMLTAEAEKAQVLEAVKAGATAYIVKPVSQETIAKKFLDVIDWVNKKRVASNQEPIILK